MRKKILAGLMSTALLCSLIPASYSLINNESSSFFSVDGAEAVSTVVYSTGFEDGINDFTGRGGVETLQIVWNAVTEEKAGMVHGWRLKVFWNRELSTW